jgi:hypothetical protein
MDITSINLKQHGDGKQVYVNIQTGKGEMTLRSDRISVFVGRELPDPFNENSPVNIMLPDRSMILKRMWVNQPSTLQDDHALHGVNVLAEQSNDEYITVYFTAGNIISQRMSRLSLSEGWRV